MSGGAKVLVVDDHGSTRDVLAALLADEGFDVTVAEDGRAALAHAELSPPDLILSDLQMPDLGGLGLLRQLRAHPSLSDVPVIIMSAYHDTQHRIEAFALGADDFVPKPVDVAELSHRIRRHVFRASRQQDAVRQSVTDPLTGTLNRRGIENFFARSAAAGQGRKNVVSVVLADVDDFKAINDRFGHVAGDIALRSVARMLRDNVRATDGVGRIGGDEFLVILPQADARIAEELLKRLRAQLPLQLVTGNGVQMPITFSAGAASATQSDSLDALVTRADRAMYEDKRRSGIDPSAHGGATHNRQDAPDGSFGGTGPALR